MPSRYRAIAEYYDAEYADSRLLQEDVPFLLDHLPRRRQDVLELCVGTARAAVPLAQAGHRVVGVDYDADLLAIAAPQAGRGRADRPPARPAAGRRPGAGPGPAVRLGRAAVQHAAGVPDLAEQDRLLGTVVRRHLKPGGRFWLDVFNPDLNLLAAPRSDGLDPHVFHVPALDRTVHGTTSIRRDAAGQTQEVTFHYTWFDARGRRRRERNRFTMTWLFPRELRLLLERNGLAIEHLYGNYDGSPVVDGCPRLIACCRLG